MKSEFETRLDTVDEPLLTPLVRVALQNAGLTVRDWTYELLHGVGGEVAGGVCGIYRFKGHAQEQRGRVPWSMVLKAFCGELGTAGDDRSQWNYWKREVLAYQTGLLADLPGGLAAPRCFGVVDYPGEEYWVWLEDLGEGAEPEWPLERYGLAAQHLGQFNGAYLAGAPLPVEPWLSTGRVREWLDGAAPLVKDLDSLVEEPIVRRWLGGDGRERMLKLWSQRAPLLEGLDRLPRCLCHHDAFRRNLIARRGEDGREETVGIDWSIVGTGAIGEEIAPLVGVSLQFLDVPMKDARELEQIVLEGYVVGLRDAGWQGDVRLVRFGYAASLALFLGFGNLYAVHAFFLDDEKRRWWEQAHKKPFDYILEQSAQLQRFLFERGEEAQELLKTLR